MNSTAEKLLITKPRTTEALDHGRVRQIFDVVNCPGMVVIWEGFSVGGEFETVSQLYELGDAIFESASDALVAWDQQQTDAETLDALAQALLRWRHGLARPLWEERTAKDKAIWIGNARSFHERLSALGFEVVRRDR